jgi:hypothetical protein
VTQPGDIDGSPPPQPDWWAQPTTSYVPGTDPARVSQPLPPEVPPLPEQPPSAPEAFGTRHGGRDQDEGEWWRKDGGDPPSEGQESAAERGEDTLYTAREIGIQIGEAVADRLPDPHAAAERHGLDIRWLRLKINIPAIGIALLATWGGRTAVDRMAASISADGLLAPIGWLLCFFLLGLIFMVLPIGSWLAAALSAVVTSLFHGVVRLLQWAWSAPYFGYLMRLVAAVAVWSFAFAAARVAGRGAIHFLTGA